MIILASLPDSGFRRDIVNDNDYPVRGRRSEKRVTPWRQRDRRTCVRLSDTQTGGAEGSRDTGGETPAPSSLHPAAWAPRTRHRCAQETGPGILEHSFRSTLRLFCEGNSSWRCPESCPKSACSPSFPIWSNVRACRPLTRAGVPEFSSQRTFGVSRRTACGCFRAKFIACWGARSTRTRASRKSRNSGPLPFLMRTGR
ncbi:MAG: hypothetical protein BWY06_03460 [Candidatus Latescibacteria bacterium ADurb.Bin168]|nr:MAG: hypothetical protein BWY06_03460 [Candidatus Latescibacteria bacterium ADurb.Bin168]